ncbi:hypothetical protein EYC84_001639 [Monilinia fructicola]|uniref:Uncharacterized protein n=1 Tax=Monilinia fructicola TaxID=38448 RepID=A0A5M9JUT8_MONFR|nr:hypothetical protein EYC84_001639 [Monilinia fructicola]
MFSHGYAWSCAYSPYLTCMYFVCDAVATMGPGSPSTSLLIRIVVKAIDLPTFDAVASMFKISPTCAVPT